MSMIDAPDGQNAVVNAQSLLATVPSGTASVTVALPVNAETLVVFGDNTQNITPVFARGTTSLMLYPVTTVIDPLGVNQPFMYYIAVNPVVDSSVLVEMAAAPTRPWYVVSDQGVRSPADVGLSQVIAPVGAPTPTSGLLVLAKYNTDTVTLEADGNGRLVPLVPQLTALQNVTAANQTVLNAPSVGGYYLFDVDYAAAAATDIELMVSGSPISLAYVSAGTTVPVHLSGYRITGAVTATPGAAACFVTLRYAIGP